MSEELINAAKAQVLAYNEKDWNKVRTLVTADFVYDEVPTQRKVEGVDQTIEIWETWAKAFPDSSGTFDSADIVSGNKVVLEITWHATHTGLMLLADREIPATGKRIELRACQILEIEAGKIKSMRHYFDVMTMMQQLGLAE